MVSSDKSLAPKMAPITPSATSAFVFACGMSFANRALRSAALKNWRNMDTPSTAASFAPRLSASSEAKSA